MADVFKKVQTELKLVGRFLTKELTQELINQGHVEGNSPLVGSIRADLRTAGRSLSLEISFFKYGIFVDQGRKPGKKKVPIAALIQWVRQRAIATGNKEIKKAAFAIQTKIFKEGIPTKSSLKFSKTGKRTGWFSDTLDKNENKVVDMLGSAALLDMDVFMDNLVSDANKRIRS